MAADSALRQWCVHFDYSPIQLLICLVLGVAVSNFGVILYRYVTHQQRLLFAAATWLMFAVFSIAFSTWFTTTCIRFVFGDSPTGDNAVADDIETKARLALPSAVSLGVLVATEFSVYAVYLTLFSFRLTVHGNWFKRVYNHIRPVQVFVHLVSAVILSGFLNMFSGCSTEKNWSLMSSDCLTMEGESCSRYNARGILLFANVAVFGLLYGIHHVYASKNVLGFSAVPQPLSYSIRDRTLQYIIPTSLRLAIRTAFWAVIIERVLLEALCGYDLPDSLAHLFGGTTHADGLHDAASEGDTGPLSRIGDVVSEMCWLGWTVLCLTFLWEFARMALETLQTKLPLAEVSDNEIIEALGADDTPLLQCLGFKLLLRRLQQPDEGRSLFTTTKAAEACPWDKASEQCIRVLKRIAGNADPLGTAEAFDMSVFDNKYATRPLQDPELAGKGNVAVRLLVGDYGGDPRGGGADATLNGWPLYNARAPNLSSASVTNPTRGSTAGFRQVPLGSGGVSLGARVDAMLLALRWRLSWYHPTMSKAQVLQRLYGQASGTFIVHAPDGQFNKGNDAIVLTLTVTRNATPSTGGATPAAISSDKQCTWSGNIYYSKHSGFELVGARRPRTATPTTATPTQQSASELANRKTRGNITDEGVHATMGFDTVEQLVQHYAKDPYEIDFAGDKHVLVDIADRSVVYTWPRVWLGALWTRLLTMVQSTRVVKAALDSTLDDRRRTVWADFPCALWALRCLARGLTNVARMRQFSSGTFVGGSGFHGNAAAPADHQRRVEHVVLALLRVDAAVQKHTGRYISAGLDSIPDAPEVSTHRFATARSKGQRRAAVTSVLPAEDYGFHGEINQSLLRIVRANPNEVAWLLERCKGDDATLVQPHADEWKSLVGLWRQCPLP